MSNKSAEQLHQDIEQLREKVTFAIEERDAWQAQFEAEQKAHNETKSDRATVCGKLDRVKIALRDAISTYGPKPEILVTEERVEAWKQALDA